MHNYAKCAFFPKLTKTNLLVFYMTWFFNNDFFSIFRRHMEGCGAVDMRRELEGLTSGFMWVEKGSTARNEVLKPNRYIVAGLF